MNALELQRLNGPLYQECIALALLLTKERHQARDLVQEAYYLANKRQDTFDEGSNLNSWVKRIVYNTFVSDYRKVKRRQELIHEKPPADSWIDRKTTDNTGEHELYGEDLRKVIESVPPLYRRPFLQHMNGMTYQQIATSRNIPIGTIKSRVFTARRLMKAQILANQQ